MGTGAAAGEMLEGDTLFEYTNVGRYKDNTMQASLDLQRWEEGKQGQQHSMGRSTVSESWEVLTHHHHIFRKIGTARTYRRRVWGRTWAVDTPSMWI